MKPNTTHSKSKTFHQGIPIEDVIEFVAAIIETEDCEIIYNGSDQSSDTWVGLKTKYVVTVTKYNT